MSYIARVAESYRSILFSQEELSYYARHLLLPSVGTVGQQKLKAARVLVVGAGGLGCPFLQALAGAGVGHLTIVDGDAVAISNVSRQWLHRVEDAGRNKAVSAAEKLGALNPFICIESHPKMLDASNADALIEAHDCVIDATDDLDVRYLIDEVCAKWDRPWVHAALYRESAQFCVFWDKCGARFDKLFPERSAAPTCAGAGMLGAVASVTANLQALEAIKLITGSGVPKVGEVTSVHATHLQIQGFRLPDVVLPEVFPEAAVPSHAMTRDALHQAQSIGEPIEIFDLRSGEAEGFSEATKISAEAILESGLPNCGQSKVLLVCEEGLVSGLLADALRSRGQDKVFHLDGGQGPAPLLA
ncbi:MAG: ThiF family adenylyltransferase [Opitutaceae bacterium]